MHRHLVHAPRGLLSPSARRVPRAAAGVWRRRRVAPTRGARRAPRRAPRCSEHARFDLPLTRIARGSRQRRNRQDRRDRIVVDRRRRRELVGRVLSEPARGRARARLSRRTITVLNRGVNGDEAADMLARFDTGVIAEKPDLVLWQVGTNSVLRDHPLRRTPAC